MRLLRLLAVATIAVLLAGCGSGTGAVIDGWPIGAEVSDCPGRTFTPSCDELIAAARTALEARDGAGHPAVLSAKLYYEFGGPTRTTGNIVAVFVLADGSRRAIFTGWSPGGSVTVDYGP